MRRFMEQLAVVILPVVSAVSAAITVLWKRQRELEDALIECKAKHAAAETSLESLGNKLNEIEQRLPFYLSRATTTADPQTRKNPS